MKRVFSAVAKAAADETPQVTPQVTLQVTPQVTAVLADLLKVTPQAVRKDLAVLQKRGLIEKRGSARTTYYVLKGDPRAS